MSASRMCRTCGSTSAGCGRSSCCTSLAPAPAARPAAAAGCCSDDMPPVIMTLSRSDGPSDQPSASTGCPSCDTEPCTRSPSPIAVNSTCCPPSRCAPPAACATPPAVVDSCFSGIGCCCPSSDNGASGIFEGDSCARSTCGGGGGGGGGGGVETPADCAGAACYDAPPSTPAAAACSASCCDKSDACSLGEPDGCCGGRSASPPARLVSSLDDCAGGCCASPVVMPLRGCADACCDDESDADIEGNVNDVKDTGNDDEDDDTLCPCCVRLLVQTPAALGLSLSESIAAGLLPAALPDISAPSTPAPSILDDLSRTMRRCCRMLKSFCAQKECCFVTPSDRRKKREVAPAAASTCLQPKENTKADVVVDEDARSTGTEPLTLEIGGMDCVDCLPKVERALSRLPSVKPLGLDYLAGIATLVYDPESVTPDAVARYVARATGFQIRAVEQGERSSGAAGRVILPVRLARPPPSGLMESLRAWHRTELGGFEELSLDVEGNNAQLPRDVLARFEPYGPTLLPANALDDADDRSTHDLRRIAYRTLAACTLSIPVLVFAWAPLLERPAVYGGLSVGLTTLILAIGFPIVSSSARSLFYLREADMGLLVAVSTLTAYVFSLFAFAFELAGRRFTEPFFETTALLVSLIYVGRLVQATSRRSASSAVRALQDLQSGQVILLESKGQSTVEVKLDARLLHYGDIIRIRADTRIPTDGLVVDGSSEVDQSSTTGESLPTPKSPGSAVIAGTLNLNGQLDIQVTRLLHENSLARIAGLVKLAQASKSRFQDVADRVSAIILPVAAVVALISFVVWLLVEHFVRSRSAPASAVRALTYGLSVLIVSCPCAIGLAVPLVVASTMRAGLREGVLFRSSSALQAAQDVDVVAFDKTGTLSSGRLSLAHAEIVVQGAEALIVSMTASSGHPISKTIAAHVATLCTEIEAGTRATSGFVSLPGSGVKAVVAGYPFLGGNARFTGATGAIRVQDLTERGLTLFTVTLGGELLATFGLADTARPEAAGLIAGLIARGKRVALLSGDHANAVERFARSIDLPLEDVRSACSPEDKAVFIAALQQSGHKVAAVGDGTNDGPALAQADLSLSVGSASDVAVAASSAVISGSDLRRSVFGALDLATHARQHMVASLAWCVVYFVAAILLASGAFVRFRIEPQWAGLGELVSILPVVAISLGLDLRWRWLRRRQT